MQFSSVFLFIGAKLSFEHSNIGNSFRFYLVAVCNVYGVWCIDCFCFGYNFAFFFICLNNTNSVRTQTHTHTIIFNSFDHSSNRLFTISLCIIAIYVFVWMTSTQCYICTMHIHNMYYINTYPGSFQSHEQWISNMNWVLSFSATFIVIFDCNNMFTMKAVWIKLHR